MPQATELTQAVQPAVSTTGKSTRRKDSDFNQCLKQYAAAALGVASVSAFSSAAPAHHIVYTPANIPLVSTSPSSISIDLNHDAVTDFTISATGATFTFSGHGGEIYGLVNVAPSPGNFAIGGHAIPQGAAIQYGGAFKSTKQQLAFAEFYQVSGYSKTISNGAFENVTNKYLGVRFLINGNVHFGWIRLTLTCHLGVVSGAITGYAFNTTTGQGLLAGQIRPTAPGDASAKTPIDQAPAGAIGMLALGSSAIPFWRK